MFLNSKEVKLIEFSCPHRPGYGAFDVDDIDPSLCTHGMYGFADLDNATWTIKVWDPW